MTSTTQSSQFDTLTPIQVQVLQSLVAGQSFTAAKEAGVHRTSVHPWTRTLPTSPVKLVAQRPTTLSTAFSDPAFEKLDTGPRIAEIIDPPKTARPAPAPAAARSSPSAAAATPFGQARAA